MWTVLRKHPVGTPFVILTLPVFIVLLYGTFVPGGAEETKTKDILMDNILKRLEKIEREGGENTIAKKLGLNLYGFVDLSYIQNFNNPSTNLNYLRIFDKEADSFNVQMAQIVLERLAKTGGDLADRAGFRIRLDFGDDTQFTGGSDYADEVDFQEVYAQYIAPFGNGIDLRVGRQNTLIGYEVISSPFNANFSRSWLFGLGEPFTTTGVRARYTFNEVLAFAIGGISSFTQGQGDTNRGTSMESAIYFTPTDSFGMTGWLFYGPEGATGGPAGNLIHAGGILDVRVTDQTSIVIESYYANQENANGLMPGKTARWDGVAGYIIHDFTEKWGFRVRGEIFEDAGASRTCLGQVNLSVSAISKTNVCFGATGNAPAPPIAQTLWETTYTLQYKPVPSLMTRLEFRYDKSNKNTFQYGTRAANHQETLSAEVIFLF